MIDFHIIINFSKPDLHYAAVALLQWISLWSRHNCVPLVVSADKKNGSGGTDSASSTKSDASCEAKRVQIGLEYPKARSEEVVN